MELVTKTKVVKLRSYIEKYLIAGEEQDTVFQSRDEALWQRARWFVEQDEAGEDVIRLKSWNGKYLTASDMPFLLGVTGNKVTLTSPENATVYDIKLKWVPVRDGFQVKLKSWCGTFLRGNGGTPPWRNTVTHDDPLSGTIQRWILWDVEVVQEANLVADYLWSLSSLNSPVPEGMLEVVCNEDYDDVSELGSPVSVVQSLKSNVVNSIFSISPNIFHSPKELLFQEQEQFKRSSGMDFFINAKAVRLRSHHDKYLHADEDEESVTQDRNGFARNAKWVVEHVPGTPNIIRLKSCYSKYLTASNQPFLLGMTGHKVLQTVPSRLDSSVEWEPVREGQQVKLKTQYGNYLRANGGLPPWRNSVTHDVPHRTSSQAWLLWDVSVVEIQVRSNSDHHDNHSREDSKAAVSQLDSSLAFESTSPRSSSVQSSGRYSREESSDSYVGSPPKLEGRTIYYHIADENGEVDDDGLVGYAMSFKGNSVEGLTQKLREETGLYDIVVCSRSPLNGKLYPLRLQLPPNNADMHVVIVQEAASGFLAL